MKLNALPILLVAPVLLGLVAAYPHRAEILKGYRDEAEGPATEKSVRHIDGLDGVQRVQSAKDLEQVMRQMEDQMKSGNGKWSVKYSEYSSSSAGGAGAGDLINTASPVRATITGEAFQGGDAIIGVTANCRNCRMRVRKVGVGGPVNEADGSSVHSSAIGSYNQQSGTGLQESSQSRYYNSRSEGGYLGGTASVSRDSEADRTYAPARPLGLSAGTVGGSGSHVVKTSRVVEQTGVSGTAGASGGFPEFSSLGSGLSGSTGSSRKEVKVTKSSWNLADLGYGTSNIEDIMRRLEEDLRTGRFENGKTVTTVTTSSSVNGEAPVVHKETFVKDGFDSTLAAGNSINIGRSEIEDLMQKLREDLREGKTQSGKTVTTVITSTSIDGATPVVKKETYVKDGFDGSTLEGFGVGSEFEGSELGSSGTGSGTRKIVKTTHTRKVFTSKGGSLTPVTGGIDQVVSGDITNNGHSFSSYGIATGLSRNSGNSHDTRTVDSLGGGHLIREAGIPQRPDRLTSLSSQESVRQSGTIIPVQQETSSTYHKETRRVDRLGGAHLIRETGTGDAASRGSSLSVAQMKGYRKNAPDEDYGGIASGSYAGNSKYYSSFDSSSALNSGGSHGLPGTTLNAGQEVGGQRVLSHGESINPVSSVPTSETVTSGQIQRSSSSYQKVLQYGSSGDRVGQAQIAGQIDRERDLDHLGGGHLLRDVNPQTGHTSVVHANTENSQGKVERQQGQGFSSYSVSISGSSGSNGQGTQRLTPVAPLSPSYRPQVPVVQPDVTGNLAFINAEQGGSRIPEAGSSSYFSSHASAHHKLSGLTGVNPGSPVGPIVVPVAPIPASTEQRLVGSGSSDSHFKSERRVDRLGEGHLLKRVDGSRVAPAPTGVSGGAVEASSSSSYSRKVDWSSSGVQTFGTEVAAGENFDETEEEFPLSSNPAPTSPSIKLGYGTGNGGYGGPVRSGGQLSTSLLDLGISPSYGDQRNSESRVVSGSNLGKAGAAFGSSGGYGYGAGGGYSSSRHYEKSSTGYGINSAGSSGLTSGIPLGSESRYGSTSATGYSGSGGALYGSGVQSSGYRSHSYSSGAGSLYQQQRLSDGKFGQDCEQSQVQAVLPVRP